ncbi:MAG: hypothetical protein IPG04_21485 [Polyangiaceae bacterium]|nr:hypothetical protein [Polyangiaceae bacterium]
MDQTKKQGRGSRGTLRAMMGALTVLGIAVMATGAGMGCSDPCANTVEDKNDECSFAPPQLPCNDLYECDAGEGPSKTATTSGRECPPRSAPCDR